jgi:hypothetical protein
MEQNNFIFSENIQQKQNLNYKEQQQTILPVTQKEESPKQQDPKNEEAKSAIFFVLGFFCIFIWLLDWHLYKNSVSSGARNFAKVSLWFFGSFILLNYFTLIFYTIVSNVYFLSRKN